MTKPSCSKASFQDCVIQTIASDETVQCKFLSQILRWSSIQEGQKVYNNRQKIKTQKRSKAKLGLVSFDHMHAHIVHACIQQ